MKTSHLHNLTFLPCLGAKMEAAGATAEALAHESGVNSRSIWRTRKHGTMMDIDCARAVYEALNTRKFKRDPRGAYARPN